MNAALAPPVYGSVPSFGNGRRGSLFAAFALAAVACQSSPPRATSDVVAKPPPIVDAAPETSATPAVAAAPGKDGEEADADPGVQPTDIASANAFTLALYKTLRKKKGNLVFSGTSLRMACGAAQLGADGATTAEMAAALRTAPDPLQAAAHAKAERTDWATVTDSELSIANHVWVSERFDLHPSYVATLASAYGTRADRLDFDAPDRARSAINRWAAESTKKKIPRIVETIGPETAALLTNAVYFNGRWKKNFETYLTKDAAFHLDHGPIILVPMMRNVTDELPFAKVTGATVIEKPYGKRGRMAMLVVLPDRVDGLEELEASLSLKRLWSWISSLEVRTVDISLPKFAIERELPMVPVLMDLGMKSAFDERTADFSRLAGGNVFVSDVVQRALIEVDERGTVAVAATGVALAQVSTPQRTPFVADHPFLFFLRDTQTGRILFMGRVMDPKAG